MTPLVADYVHERTARIGNGLHLASLPPPTAAVKVVSLDPAFVTIEEFATLLVVAAARITPKRVVELLIGWLDGEPLRVCERALIRGVTVAETLGLEGITIEASSVRPPMVDHLLRDKPYRSRDPDEAVCSVELEMRPAIFKPRPGEAIHKVRERLVTTPRNRKLGASLSWERLCESMALAIPAYVGWDASWTDFGELEAFTGPCDRGVVGRERLRDLDEHPFTATTLAETVDICAKRNDRPHLDLPIRRWLRSYRAPGDDALIELRVAFEALYAGDGRGISAAIASRGAWQLGTTFEDRRAYFDILHRIYQDASSVIHAREAKHVNRDHGLMDRGRDLCRQAIRTTLEHGQPDWHDLVLGKGIV